MIENKAINFGLPGVQFEECAESGFVSIKNIIAKKKVKKKKVKKKKAGAPKWAMKPFEWFLEESEQLDQLLRLSIVGISTLQAMPRIVDAIGSAEGIEDQPNHKEKKKRAQEMAKLARKEVEGNFPLLHAQNLVTIWSLMEALIRTFVSEWIAHYPKSISTPSFGKIKVNLVDYNCIPDDEKPLYIVEQLERELGAGLRKGINRFESILKPFGFSGEVSKETRKYIFELGQIRNAIVHRAGHADRTLVDSCPWLNLKIGQKIKVSKDIYIRCYGAAHAYIIQIISRIGEKYGKDMSKFKNVQSLDL